MLALNQTGYLFIAIGLVVVLVIIFFVSYLINKKTPVPKGCEDIRISDENCSACGNMDCHIKRGIDLKKLEEEIKEDN